MLTSGTLTERVEILEPVSTNTSQFGGNLTDWQKVATLWANAKFKKGVNALNLGEDWMARTVVFTFRNNSVITERHRLGWDGKIYAIESLNRDKKEGSMTITAEALDGEG